MINHSLSIICSLHIRFDLALLQHEGKRYHDSGIPTSSTRRNGVYQVSPQLSRVRSHGLLTSIRSNEPNIVDITRQNPGQTFVGILPGHDRPAFVRKRSRRRSGSCFTDMFRPRRTYSSEHVIHHTYIESNRPYYFTRPSSSHQTKIVTDCPVVISSSGQSLPERLKKVRSFDPNPNARARLGMLT